MSMNRTLIAYETKGGVTEESARKIAEVLRSNFGLEVDLVDLKVQKSPDLSQYRNIVIGGGVRAGKVYSQTLKFLENDLSGKRVAFYVSSAQAGTPSSHDKAKIKFVESTLNNYSKIEPVSTEAFGGRIKLLGKTLADNVDMLKVEAWAMELGKMFVEK